MLRTLLAGLAGLLAAVLLPASVLSVWVDGVVTDTDRYVETVTPLADDDVVKAAAVKELEREALQLVAATGTGLSTGAATQQLVHLAVERVVESPTFRTAWVQANRTAHEQLIAVLEDRSTMVLDDRGRVTIELGTVLTAIAQDLAARGLIDPDRVPDMSASFAVMDADQLAKARRAYDALDALGFWLPVAWALMILLTLLLARRRLATTSKLALASLLTLGLLALALVLARSALTDDLPDRDVARAVWDVLLAGLWRSIEVIAIVLAVVALVTGLLGRRRGQPGPQA
jgi:hypothetical protein